MTIITKPITQERKDEKAEDKTLLVEGKGDVLVLSKGGTIVLPPDNSTRIHVGKYGEAGAVPKRPPTSATVSRHVVVMTQLCIMGTLIFAVTVGLSIAMHSYYMVGRHRQFYKGYCRIPYPSMMSNGLLSASDFAPSNKKQIGLELGVHGGSTVITGDFVDSDSKKDLSKKQQFTKFMEKLVQKLVAPTQQEHSKGEESFKGVRSDKLFQVVVEDGPRDGGPLLDGSLNRRQEPKVSMTQTERILPDGKFELDYDLDIDFDQEELQMPALSKGKYLHDFKMNKTAIIDIDENRCFVLSLNRQDIAPPRTLYDIIQGLTDGAFEIDIEEIRQDMKIVYPAVENLETYGPIIQKACDGKKTYHMEPVGQKHVLDKMTKIPHQVYKRSATTQIKESTELKAQKQAEYQEFAGKFITYNIVNLDEI